MIDYYYYHVDYYLPFKQYLIIGLITTGTATDTIVIYIRIIILRALLLLCYNYYYDYYYGEGL